MTQYFKTVVSKEKHEIIKFLGNYYINIPLDGVPYVALEDNKYWILNAYFSTLDSVRVVEGETPRLCLYFTHTNLSEIYNFSKLLDIKNVEMSASVDDGANPYFVVVMYL